MKVKEWSISLFTYNPDKKIKDDYFSTGDTEALLKIHLKDKPADIQKVTFTLHNKTDDSLISQSGQWKEHTAYFILTDELLAHAGKWVFQVVFEGEQKVLSRPLTFTIDGYLLDEHPPKLEIIENWDLIMKQAQFLVDELEQFVNDFELDKSEIEVYKKEVTLLINSLNEAQNKELKRQTNETKRLTQENNRQNKEVSRQENESHRISEEDYREVSEKTRLMMEDLRKMSENERISNENTRKNNENTRGNDENIRRSYENDRQQNETIRQQNETKRQNSLAPRIGMLENKINGEPWIIESGSNSNGEWVKLNDGTMMSWYGSPTQVFNVTSTWGSLFYSQKISWNYPLRFIKPPRVFVEFNEFSGNAFTIRSGEKKTNINSGEFHLLRPTSGNVQGNIDFFAIGKWK